MPNIQNVIKYCENSSLAGVGYIISGYNWLHKLFWFFSVIVVSVVGLYITFSAWREWEEVPYSRSSENVDVTELMFPAVTICSSTASPWLAYQHVVDGIEADEKLYKKLPLTMKKIFNMRLKKFTEEFGIQNSFFRLLLENIDCEECDYIRWNSELEEWFYKIDRYHMVSCRNNDLFCSFHNNTLTILKQWEAQGVFKILGKQILEKLNDTDLTHVTIHDVFQLVASDFFDNLEDPLQAPKEISAAFLRHLQDAQLELLLRRSGFVSQHYVEPFLAHTDVFMANYSLLDGGSEDVQHDLSELAILLTFTRESGVETPNGPICLPKNLAAIWMRAIDQSYRDMYNIESLRLLYSRLSPQDMDLIRMRSNHSEALHCDPNVIYTTEKLIQYLKVVLSDDGLSHDGCACCRRGMPMEEANQEECECRCNKMLKLAIFKMFKAIQRPDITNLGQVLAWFIRFHLKRDYERHSLDAYTSGQVEEDPEFVNLRSEIHSFDRDVLLSNLQPEDSLIVTDLQNIFHELTMTESLIFEPSLFPKLQSWPPCARKLFNQLFNWDEEAASLLSNRVFILPFFDIISTMNVSLAAMCESEITLADEIIACYCRYANLPLAQGELTRLMQLMRVAVDPSKTASTGKGYRLPEYLTPRDVDPPRPQLTHFPFCFYGSDTESLAYGLPDMNDVDYAHGRNEKEYQIKQKMNYSGTYRLPPCKLFQARPTGTDMCHTFNSLPLDKILKRSNWLTAFQENFEEEASPQLDLQATYGQGYKKGLILGLNALTHINTSLGRDYTDSNVRKFWVKAHGSGDIPMVSNHDLASTFVYNTESKPIASMAIKVGGEMNVGTMPLRALAVEARNCLFPSESNLRLFEYYSTSNCWLECLWTSAYDTCGCKPWFIPALDEEVTCNILGNICFLTTMKMLVEQKMDELCTCLPGCEYNVYTLKPYPDGKMMNLTVVDLDKKRKVHLNPDMKLRQKITTVTSSFNHEKFHKWFNLGAYIQDDQGIIYPRDAFLKQLTGMTKDMNNVLEQQADFVELHIFLNDKIRTISKSTMDILLSFTDKISWIGGTIGAFNGFCLISFIEILYWIAMVVFGYKDAKEEEEMKKCWCENRMEKTDADLEEDHSESDADLDEIFFA